jgi:hypothetical protein
MSVILAVHLAMIEQLHGPATNTRVTVINLENYERINREMI